MLAQLLRCQRRRLQASSYRTEKHFDEDDTIARYT